jgi:hypothetical protein
MSGRRFSLVTLPFLAGFLALAGGLSFASHLSGRNPVASHLRAAPTQPAADSQTTVDIELILAVDISYSMDMDELALQRDGYARAITSHEFINALRQGLHGKVAITYFEWAGAGDQKVVVPWRVIDGPEAAGSVANEILQAPLRRAARTSISGALLFALTLFEANNTARGIRRVIDVSGDGPNNHGPLVVVARDEVLSKGISINGLPIMLKRPSFSTMDIERLDEYYEDCVIGGPASFVVPVNDREKFIEAIRTKLVLEVAGRVAPPARVQPVSAAQPRVPCTVGERLWQERWGN